MADVSKKYLDYYFTRPSEAGFEVFLNHKQKKRGTMKAVIPIIENIVYSWTNNE